MSAFKWSALRCQERIAVALCIGVLTGLTGCGSSTVPAGGAATAAGTSSSPLTVSIGNPQPDSTPSCSLPSAARAGEQMSVSGPMGRVVIDRQPFHLSILDPSGKTVLSEMDNTLPLPAVYAQPSALPGGSNPGIHQTTYAPLGFVTGATVSSAYPASIWSGNLLLGVAAGIQYTVCRVESAVAIDQGLQLKLSTNDPAGSQFTMTISADGTSAFHIVAALSQEAGDALVVDSFQSPAGEAFHGFGGLHNALDQSGQFFYNWIEEENFGAGPLQSVVSGLPGTGGNAYLFPNGPAAAYYVQSLFYSSKGYGFLLNQPQLSLWSMASDRADAWQVAVAENSFDYTVAPGDQISAIGSITAINGRQRVPPAWAVGPMYDRLVVQTDPQLQDYYQEVQTDLANFTKYSLPVSGYRVEGWVELTSAELSQTVQQIKSLGAHPLFYFRPFVSLVSDGFEMPDTASQALIGGYVATLSGSAPYIFGDSFEYPAVLIDFTNPLAADWWQSRIRAALDQGADGFMQDFGEQVQPDMQFASGENGTDYHNQYPVDYHRRTRQLLDQYVQENPGRELFYFTRSGYSGRPGTAAAENANFPGDELTDYSRSAGLASLTTDMLNRAVGGAYGYTTDIGGYEDLYTGATTKELLLRWAEWAALSPFFRLHNSASHGTQMPWDFDQETVDDYRAMAQLHLKAAPLILQLWQQAQVTGIPPTLPLWLAYPSDPVAAQQDQEWLLGSDVLVAPVVTEGATTQNVYLPAGCWIYVPSGAKYSGGATVTVGAPLGTLPYFFHCGTQPF